MKTIRLVFTLATLFSLCQSAHAQGNSPEAYAVLDDNGTLTYYYGTNKPESDNVYDIPWDNSDDFYPLWPSESINEVIIDPSFSGYQPESMAYLFSSLGDATSISGLEHSYFFAVHGITDTVTIFSLSIPYFSIKLFEYSVGVIITSPVSTLCSGSGS